MSFDKENELSFIMSHINNIINSITNNNKINDSYQ